MRVPGNVMALVAFIFIVFGIVGMEVFKGVLHYRCTSEPGYREPQGHPLNERRLEELAFLNGMGGMGGGSVGGVASSHAIFGGVDGGALMAPYALVSTANASALAALAGAMGGRLNSSSSREGSSRSRDHRRSTSRPSPRTLSRSSTARRSACRGA